MNQLGTHPYRRRAVAFVSSAAISLLAMLAAPPVAWANPPIVPIAQYPLTAAIPAHPQVVIALANPESMDGSLSGALMTGSGAFTGGEATFGPLANSSSPVNYNIPAGFTPPLNPGAGGVAPYTVVSGGVEYDNSPSRLNVAKQAIGTVLQNFMEYADFALFSYRPYHDNAFDTMVVYMSPVGQPFSFTSTPGANRFVANPCYNATYGAVDTYDANCTAIANFYGMSAINQPDMLISESSDDSDINDVLYAQTTAPPLEPCAGNAVWVTYGGPNPANPYTHYTLANFNAGGITETYSHDLTSNCANTVGATNSGYLPFSQQVMYAARGYGYGGITNNEYAQTVTLQSAGQAPTPASVAAAIAPFTPFLLPETDISATTEIKAGGNANPVATLEHGAYTYFTTTNPPSTNGCPPTRYVLLVSDGLPTLDLAGKYWPPLGTEVAAGYGVTASFNGDGSLNTTNDQALTDAIAQIAAAKAAGIKTYIVGVGAGVDPAVNPTAAASLTAMAVAGGTGNYFADTSEAQVVTDLQVILAKILAETAATSAAAVNSTGLNTTSVAYQGTFTTSDVNEDWTGNLLAFPINPQTGFINTALSAALWSAQAQLDQQSYITPGRLIVTWDPVAGAGTPFEWNPNVTVNGISPSTVLGQDLETYLPDPSGSDVVNYLRGDHALEQLNGGTFRNRTHLLGDIVDSSPLYVGPAAGPWQQASYASFQNSNASRTPMLYIGANDGMLHGISAATGNEVFAYIPHGVYGNLINLVSPFYNEGHLFYVDGSPQAADVQFASDSSWHTLLFGGEGGGGKSIYALDVTNPSNFTTEANVAQAALWEFTSANMGLTYSPPVAVKTAAGFAIMFGNGYDSTPGVPILYAINPQTGAVMAQIELCAAVPAACNGALPNGLSAVVAANSHGQLSADSDLVYAGDLQGNLWRVNISNANPANWSVSVLFQARDPSGNPQPITVAPVVSLNPLVPTLTGMMVYFGTGQFLGIPDLTNVQVQTIYGVFDAGTAPAMPLLRASLVQQTMTSTAVTNMAGFSTTIRQLSANPVNLPAKKGWYVDLSLVSGERDVTDPTLFNGTLQVTTFQPNGSTCTGGGNAWYTIFNYATGGATVEQQFDWNFQNTVNNNDLYMGQTVAGVSLGTAYAAGPKMVTGAGGAMVYTTSGAGEVTQGANAGTCTSIGGTTSCIPNWANIDSQSHGAWTEVR